MAVTVRLTVRMPRRRIAVALFVLRVLSPVIRSEVAQERIGAAIMAWVQRGLIVRADS